MFQDPVFWSHHMPGLEGANLRKLICAQRQRLDDEVVGAEVMKCPVAVTIDLQIERGVSDIIAVDLDASTWERGFHEDIVRHRAVRPPIRAWRHRFTPGQKDGRYNS